MSNEYRFSPLAKMQLDALWDNGYHHFGEQQADDYLDGLFSANADAASTGHYLGLSPSRVPPDKIADITSHPIPSTTFVTGKNSYIVGNYQMAHSELSAFSVAVWILQDGCKNTYRLNQQI